MTFPDKTNPPHPIKRIRVLHISTAQRPQDPRVVFKQCQTLTSQYEVWCALPHANPALAPDIRFIRLPFFRRVIWRVLITSPYILLRCLWLQPAIVHVYVPEFVPFAFIFRLAGAAVIYEVQENLFKKMHLKAFNRGPLLEWAFRRFDALARQHFYLIFTEHGYLDTYTRLSRPHVVIYNYPLLSLLEPFRQPYQPSLLQPTFFYIGWLSFERAFDTLVSGLAQLRPAYPMFVMHLFGRRTFDDVALERLPEFNSIRSNMRFYGYTDQRDAFPYARQATAGLALLKPVGDYPDSYTTKLFEYMALGLPVITADFPLYRDVVERHQCGFCVSPYDPTQLAQTLTFLIEHPTEARQMGERGRRAVEQYYNWTTEAQKLFDFYTLILGSQVDRGNKSS
ncbi:glycosyltransferase [Spirosoma utsteinense]|uniref:Glycosyltransferase involved in cell wall biosynthesis n=1 Tax=Spirosoma utsteinense TaxID=2585773 RepID=A0ABR6W2S9_9BACT|nr:glycosyltransferase [Spirosoma utsteinense]MBC3783811.1 glycosyltransferase involved in cell wall biosynthesis [Spirosoma utsteinense]MBC3790045.1 glycosyltransferase involved in cell wall biosynthesis [Spirosoma utsteinense]